MKGGYMADDMLTIDKIQSRRNAEKRAEQVMFRVTALYGLSKESVQLPVNDKEYVDSGQICLTVDPASDASTNMGLVNYDEGTLKVKYGAQAVFPGLYKLITDGRYERGLLNPVRVIATDECTLTPNFSGWRALGCLDFLPGSLWAGAHGG
jgi:hypothetical protein